MATTPLKELSFTQNYSMGPPVFKVNMTSPFAVLSKKAKKPEKWRVVTISFYGAWVQGEFSLFVKRFIVLTTILVSMSH